MTPNPPALFIFHGTGGSADIILKPAMQYVARLTYHRGYAVVSTEAEEVTLNLASRSIPTDTDESQVSPVFAGRFSRIDGIGFDPSAAGMAELVTNGRLDPSGFPLTLPDDLLAEVAADPASWAARTLDFLEAQIP